MSKVYKYVVHGEPIALVRVTDTSSSRVWDDYKDRKVRYEISLRSQHEDEPFITGPIHLLVNFYMHIYPKHMHDSVVSKDHAAPPSLLSLFNFCERVLAGIVYKNDCQIARTTIRKIYDDNPRTEIEIRRL